MGARRWHRLMTGAVLLAVVALVGAPAGLGGSSVPESRLVGGPCTKVTAGKLEIDTVASVVCGAFLGPGSRAMVVNLTTGNCLPFVGWDVFALTGGAWQKVPLPAHGGLSGTPVVAAGAGLRETLPIRRSGDPLCNPTGGLQTRIWHWNGTALVPGAWKHATASPTAANTTHAAIYTPSRNITCTIADNGKTGGVYCLMRQPPSRVSMDSRGRLNVCRGSTCLGNFDENEKFNVLPYGRSITVGRFRCRSQTTGLTCIVAATGKGFLIARAGVKVRAPVRDRCRAGAVRAGRESGACALLEAGRGRVGLRGRGDPGARADGRRSGLPRARPAGRGRRGERSCRRRSSSPAPTS